MLRWMVFAPEAAVLLFRSMHWTLYAAWNKAKRCQLLGREGLPLDCMLMLLWLAMGTGCATSSSDRSQYQSWTLYKDIWLHTF